MSSVGEDFLFLPAAPAAGKHSPSGKRPLRFRPSMEYNRRMDARSLLAYFQGHTEEFIGLMKRLIQGRTYSGEVENINRFLDDLQNLFGEFDPRISRIQRDRGDILTLTFFPERPDFAVFLAHVDTVSVSGIPPVAVVEGDLLKGNGSFDMKGGIALFYFAMKALRHFRAIDQASRYRRFAMRLADACSSHPPARSNEAV